MRETLWHKDSSKLRYPAWVMKSFVLSCPRISCWGRNFLTSMLSGFPSISSDSHFINTFSFS